MRTGYAYSGKSVQCADCEQEFYGDEKMYINNGDVVCGTCLKERILDARDIDDLADAFDVPRTTAGEHLRKQEEPC
jgi:hypothetical protein